MFRRIRSYFALFALVPFGIAAQPCLVSYTFTTSTPPVNGTYACGQAVTFCFTVTNWNSTNANWFHSMVPSFGAGWDMSTLTPGAPPPSCAGTGTWAWYNSVQGSAATNAGPQGPGYFYNYNTPVDNNPGNNFGDFCTGAVNWQFCWTISVLNGPACLNGLGLGVSANTFGDSETGSWGSSGCTGDANPPVFPGPVVIQSCTVSAGTGGPLNLCSSSPAANLFTLLTGTPDAGGVWTGPAGAPHTGTFDPAVDAVGNFTYTVTSVAPPCSAQSVVAVSVQQQPNAGISGSTTLCSSDAPFALFDVLTGSPGATGTWTAPGGGLHSGIFVPASDAAGSYTYTITGVAPCTNATSTVTVVVNASPNAGTDGNLITCSNSPASALFTYLGGTPSVGGVWSGPGGAMGGTYNPAFNNPGAFTYTVAGVAPCPNSSATVTVVENQQPNAGTTASASLCSAGPVVSMLSLLGGTPDATGTWADPTGAALPAMIDPAIATGGVYTYTVAGVVPCVNAQSTLNLTIVPQPTAGTSSIQNLCTASPVLDLFLSLGGSPSVGGNWTGPSGASAPAMFTPGISAPGVYTYSLNANAPCTNVSATVTVNVSPQPSAGSNAVLSVCTSGTAVNLFPMLGAAAQAGGAWTAPGGAAMSGTYDPGTSAAGVYTYTVTGTAPCTSASATVTITATPASNAGSPSATPLSYCSTGAAVGLFVTLGAGAQAGGTWTTPSGAAFNGTITPATASSGAYTYTIAANAPCPSVSSVTNVIIVPTPNAGQSGVQNLCSSQTMPFSLINGLTGSPATTGNWTSPTGQAHGPNFSTATDAPGIYTYTVSAPTPCTAATSAVTITVVPAANAGTGASVALCANASILDPFTVLAGSPMVGGQWTSPSGGAVTSIDPASSVSGNYTYTIIGAAPCPNAQAVLALSISSLPQAGADASIALCDNGPTTNLILALAGAQPGGSWNGPSGAASGSFIPGTNIPGAYSYSVNGTGACTGIVDQATVDVAVLAVPLPVFNMSIAAGCAPLQVQFQNLDQAGTQSALWSFGDGGTSAQANNTWYTFASAGSYSVNLQVTDANGCVGNTTVNNAILVSSGPEAFFIVNPMRVSVLDPTVVVMHSPETNVSYGWDLQGVSVDTSGTFTWRFDPPEVGDHIVCLTATDTLGCANEMCLTVLVDDVLTIYVANAFTPNSDDRNEQFKPSIIGVDLEHYEFMIFDRWGLVVFRTQEPGEGWTGGMNNSGEILPVDVYVWRLKAKDQFTPERREIIGTVTLLK